MPEHNNPDKSYDLSDTMREALQALAVDDLVRQRWGDWVPRRRLSKYASGSYETMGLGPSEGCFSVNTLRALERRGLVSLPENDTKNGGLCLLTSEGVRVAYGLSYLPLPRENDTLPNQRFPIHA